MGSFFYILGGGATVETALKAATCIMFAAMAGVCLIGGVAVLTKPKKRKEVDLMDFWTPLYFPWTTCWIPSGNAISLVESF